MARSTDRPPSQLDPLQLAGTPQESRAQFLSPVSTNVPVPNYSNSLAGGLDALARSLGGIASHRQAKFEQVQKEANQLTVLEASASYQREHALLMESAEKNIDLSPNDWYIDTYGKSQELYNKYANSLPPDLRVDFTKNNYTYNLSSYNSILKTTSDRQKTTGLQSYDNTIRDKSALLYLNPTLQNLSKEMTELNKSEKNLTEVGVHPLVAAEKKHKSASDFLTMFVSGAVVHGGVKVPVQYQPPPDKPPGLLTKGNIDPSTLESFPQPDGSVRTVYSMSVGMEIDGKERYVVIPGISLADGHELTPDEAIAIFKSTQQHLGIFETQAEADVYSKAFSASEGTRIGETSIPVEKFLTSGGAGRMLIELGYPPEAVAKVVDDAYKTMAAASKTEVAQWEQVFNQYKEHDVRAILFGTSPPVSLTDQNIGRYAALNGAKPEVLQEAQVMQRALAAHGGEYRAVLTYATPAQVETALAALATVDKFPEGTSPQQIAQVQAAHELMATLVREELALRTTSPEAYARRHNPNATPEQLSHAIVEARTLGGTLPGAAIKWMDDARAKELADQFKAIATGTADTATRDKQITDLLSQLPSGRYTDGMDIRIAQLYQITSHMGNEGEASAWMGALIASQDMIPGDRDTLFAAINIPEKDLRASLASTRPGEFGSAEGVRQFILKTVGSEDVVAAMHVQQNMEGTPRSEAVNHALVNAYTKAALYMADKQFITNPDTIKGRLLKMINGDSVTVFNKNRNIALILNDKVESYFPPGEAEEQINHTVNEFRHGRADLGMAEANLYSTAYGNVGTVAPTSYSLPLEKMLYIKPSSFYGLRNGKFHRGMDVPINVNTPVKAISSGVAHIEFDAKGYGSSVVINHADGSSSRYSHVSKYAIREGQAVDMGQVIAYSGGAKGSPGAGNSTGPHLHFEYIDKDGKPQNPMTLFAGTTVGVAELEAKRLSLEKVRSEAWLVPVNPKHPEQGLKFFAPWLGTDLYDDTGKVVIVKYSKIAQEYKKGAITQGELEEKRAREIKLEKARKQK